MPEGRSFINFPFPFTATHPTTPLFPCSQALRCRCTHTHPRVPGSVTHHVLLARVGAACSH